MFLNIFKKKSEKNLLEQTKSQEEASLRKKSVPVKCFARQS